MPRCTSGVNVNLPHFIEKHLLLNFPYIKEAFFSKCVVLVEGETEAGAIPLWGNKVIGDLDDNGIVVIGVGGKGSIPPATKLLNHFKIPNVSIIDKDDGNDTDTTYTSIDGLRTTNFRDFEEELFESIKAKDITALPLFDFLEEYGDGGLENKYGSQDRLSKVANTYKINKTWDLTKSKYTFKEAKELSNIDLSKAMFLSWITGSGTGKNIILGRAFGQSIETALIPMTYKQLFKDALNKAK